MKKITTIFALLLMLVLVLFSAGCPEASSASNINVIEIHLEEKIFWNGTVDDDFCGSSVLVIMDKMTSGINKHHEANIFGSFDKEYIQEITTVTRDLSFHEAQEFRQIFAIKLNLPEDRRETGSKEHVIRAIRELEKIEGIRYAGPSYFYYPHMFIPNDPRFWEQWGLHDVFNGIRVPDAWNRTTGSSTVQVGIIDTGIASHPDLNANLVQGRNFVNNPSTINTPDTHGHGTHVAGIVSAVGNNSTGITGVCWNVKLVPLKIDFIDQITGETTSDTLVITRAINHARDNNIPILNFSWGGFDNDLVLKEAIRLYGISGGLFVCSAGNENRNNDINFNFPSHFTSDSLVKNYIISVGSIGMNGNKSSFSNWGASTVDIFAPGSDILSTYLSNSYMYMSGTSMSAPFVSGVAALLLSIKKDLLPVQLKEIILQSVDSFNQYQSVSRGQLNAFNAISKIKDISIFNITGVTVPVAGGTPVKIITETSQYTGTVAWNPNHLIFAAGVQYTATVTLTPKSEYTLHGVDEDFFRIPGAITVINDANSGVVTAVFPAAYQTVTTRDIPGVPMPFLGNTITGNYKYKPICRNSELGYQ